MRATVLMLALLTAGAAFAQSAPPQAAPGARHLDNLATLLDLTDTQKAQVQSILQEEHAKMRAGVEQARASGSMPDWENLKAMHEQIHEETLQKLTPVLTATQLKKFQILATEMHGRFPHSGMGGPHPGPDSAATPPTQN